MLKTLSALALVIVPFFAMAEDSSDKPDQLIPLAAADVNLSDFLWIARPLVVFADSAADPRYQEQLALLQQDVAALEERDVVVIVDTDPAARSAVRLKLRPRGFMFALVGKDGGVKLRKPRPWHVREISRQIDKMPLRRQEIEAAVSATEG